MDTKLLLEDPRFPDRKFWTFKHKPGDVTESDCLPFVETAIKQRVCMMQYEYGHEEVGQPKARVTGNWRAIAQIKKGDVVFLRGDELLYAVGVVRAHGLANDGSCPMLSIKEVTESKSHGANNQFQSYEYNGVVVFSDSDVFYEDLSDGRDEWGQRIKVGEWLYYSGRGVQCTASEYFVGQDVYPPMRELTKDAAKSFIIQLEKNFYEEVGMSKEMIDIVLANKNLVLTGAPGTGKTHTANQLAIALILGVESSGKKSTPEQKRELGSRLCSVQFHPGYDYSDFVIGLKPVLLDDEGNEIAASTGKKCSVSFDWRKGVFVKFAEQAQKSDDPYVLIIDEINRADLSRVFGELFSLIEPDYRGEDHAIKLPNGKDFYVPSNLYIIGTMNDIDRSVDSMDFALRRRFAWKEVTAEESEQIIDSKVEDAGLAETLKGAMREINQYLGGNKKVALDGREMALGLGPEYQLGGAIFANATKYGNEEAMSKVWQNHVRVILSEYLRGNKDKNGILKVFAKEFGVSED